MTRAAGSYLLFGDTVDVWPVAAQLAAQLPAGVEITVVETEHRHGEASALPLQNAYFRALGIGASELADAGGRFALGYALEGFCGAGTGVIAAPSGDLPAIAGLPLHQVLRCVAEKAGALDRFGEHYEGFRFCARAAGGGRMALPEDAADSPFAMLGPLAIIDRMALANLLRDRIAGERVENLEGEVAEVVRGGSGRVTSVRLGDGGQKEADVFVDLRQLSGEIGEVGRIGLPLLEALARSDIGIVADPLASAMPVLSVSSGTAPDSEPYALEAPWAANLIRLGPASAALGPLFSADARLLFLQAAHLAECLPVTAEMTVEARRFNRLHARSVERLYELVGAPLHLNRRDEEAWQDLRAIAPPEGLALRIEQFRGRGRMTEFDGEVADRQFWIDLLIGFGVLPGRHDRRAEAFDPRQLDAALGAVRGQIEQALAAMPTQAQFMQRFGNA
ncbi:tryptophan 7-halogenase [Qipengyuania mesophila]|uniref:tryptophan 7-halogenase n=1 Tax=Qipengyuania mesophila TaxID=2867246 RepID=UPI0035163F6E